MNQRPKILYLKHHVQDAEQLLEILEELAPAYEYLGIHTIEEYANCLQDFRPDIILVDEDLYNFSAKEALAMLQTQHLDTPLILISSVGNESEAIEFLKAGAVDYIVKEVPQRLLFVLYNQVGRLRAIETMEQAKREKERLYKQTLADTTELKVNEKQILRSKANLLTLFDHIDVAHILVNNKLKVLSYNLPAKQLTESWDNLEPEIGKNILDYFPPSRRQEVNKTVKRVLDGESISYHAAFADRYGMDRWYSIKWVSVSNDYLKNAGFVLSIREITESKVKAMALAQANEELARRNKSLEQFTYTVSHNLLAPVANIIGITDLLKDAVGEEHVELVETLQASIKSMDTTIKDLNQTLQVKDQVNKRKEEVHFRQLIEEISFSINNLIMEEGVKISCDFEALPSLYTVRGYLYSIFYNLTLNSIKYRRPEEAPLISVKSVVEDQTVFLVFEDNGKGIDMEKHGAQLFTLYKRFDTSTEGKGMGMFMVKTQIEELGGTIDVESQLGKGTKIIITLPLVAR
jgi:PAS domain S-box-containing protein